MMCGHINSASIHLKDKTISFFVSGMLVHMMYFHVVYLESSALSAVLYRMEDPKSCPGRNMATYLF
jgi:hypothetical protein